MIENEDNNIKKNKFKNVGGIDISRVINKDYLLSWGDFYKCIICSKIMINPTDCENCGHSFCNECISISKCPYGCEKKSLKPASMGIKNLLNNLKFKCFNEGCEEIISYSDVKSHDNNCPFQKLSCPNDGCNEQLLKNKLPEFGYSGWNTSANTIGSLIAALKVKYMAKEYNDNAFKKLQLIRYLDDWAYQANVRKEISEPCNIKEYMKPYEQKLFEKLNFQKENIKYSYPWNRKFEIEVII